jgi:hypothetical protein
VTLRAAMKLQQAEIEIFAKSVGISAAIAAAIPVVWLLLKVLVGIVPVLGWIVLFFASLIPWTAALPWRLLFSFRFVMDYWIWLSALDCLIAGLAWGIWSARKYRRVNPRHDAIESTNPF